MTSDSNLNSRIRLVNMYVSPSSSWVDCVFYVCPTVKIHAVVSSCLLFFLVV